MQEINKKSRKDAAMLQHARLALHGGPKVRTKKFPPYLTIGIEEEQAVLGVLRSGILSRFLGTWHEDFYGGPQVQAFEAEWAAYFGVKHAIAVNSATSGLYAAVGALGIGPGDEVIVSPYTMSASAVAPLVYGAIPVFADIEEDFYCLSAKSIQERITPRTKAIIIVDIFGQPYNVEEINKLARQHNIKVIEDCAQSPGARYKDAYAGTSGDIGIYSLNYHKHIHTGEGGVIVTNDDVVAERLRMIRNHAEAVVEGRAFETLNNMIGFNFRMTEIEAALGREQLKKLGWLLEERQKNVMYLTKQLSQVPCLEMTKVRQDATHVYYVHPLKFKSDIAGVHRNIFIEAVKAELMPIELRETEGIKIGCGYVKPLYLQPLYQKRVAFGGTHYPWSSSFYTGTVNYDKGICPVVEKMHFEELVTHELMRPGMTKDDLDDVVRAFEKVWQLRGQLR